MRQSGTVPYGCIAAEHVELALENGVDGDERQEAERWLGAQRRLTLGIPDLSHIVLIVRDPLEDANQRLMDSMGVKVIVDPKNGLPRFVFNDVENKKVRLKQMEGRRA